MCAERSRGFTLVEAVVLIVVVATAVVGVLMVFQNTVRHSADPQVNKQALAIAEALLDEILLAPYDVVAGTGATRADFNDVRDYHNYTTGGGGMVNMQGAPIAALAAYNVSVTAAVVGAALNDTPATLIPVNEAIRVTVTATGPQGFSVTLEGYRVRYGP
jgi:MSHA pilin protein MshD